MGINKEFHHVQN